MAAAQDWVDIDLPGPFYRQGRTKAEVDGIIAACRAASGEYPNEKRFPFRLGIALKHAARTAEALAAFEAARKLGSIGGYDEAAFILLFGHSSDPAWKARDGVAGMALLEEGLTRLGNPLVLQFTQAFGWLRGPDDIVDPSRGVERLGELGEAGDVHSLIALADFWLARSPSPQRTENALALYRKAFDLGSGTAAYRLGQRARGQNNAEATRYYEFGVEKENTDAMNALGFISEQGTGVSRNYQRARLLYEMAALRGHLTAQNNLGQLYMGSRGFAADYPKARLWLERAAERNHPSAVNALGMMYDHGQGVAVDRARARELYERAAALGSPGAMNNMGYLFENGRAATIDLVLAREWYEKGVAAGNGEAMSNLAAMYREGRGGPRDVAKAFQLLTQSAEKKSRQGTNNLAYAYMRGEGTARDLAKARALFRAAHDLGSNEGTHNLASMLEKGEGGKEDKTEARQLFKIAAESGIPNAMYRYAMRVGYDFDVSDDENAEKAAMVEKRLWLKRAIAAGDPYAVPHLAEMLADGLGGPRDRAEAVRLFRLAAPKDADVAYEFARRLRIGEGIPPNPREARLLLSNPRSLDAVTAYVEMLDRGEGGPKDPRAATQLLRDRVTAGEFFLTGMLAARVAKGLGTKRDPVVARALLTSAMRARILPRDAFLLATMREQGEGGAVDMPGAVAAYREAGAHEDAMSRLALILRQGRGVDADPIEARRLLLQRGATTGPGAIALIEMLDRGEGGPVDTARAGLQLFAAAVIVRDPLALELVAKPDKRISPGTRASFVDQAERAKLQPPKNALTSGPLLTAQTLRTLRAKAAAAKARRAGMENHRGTPRR